MPIFHRTNSHPKQRAILRRILVLSLAAYCASLAGCATPDVACNMKVDFIHSQPVATEGRATIAWQFNSAVTPGTYGLTTDMGDVIKVDLKQSPDGWGVCELAKFGHEMKHVLGARHG